MTKSRSTSLKDLIRLQEKMNRILKDLLPPADSQKDTTEGNWTPMVDIYETINELVVKADLPETGIDDISIRIENNVLSLSGERKMDIGIPKESYHRMEREYGRFNRSFALPDNIDSDKIEATFKDGVLKINIPKKESGGTGKIVIEPG